MCAAALGMNMCLFWGCFSGLAAAGQDAVIHEAKRRIICMIDILVCFDEHNISFS